MQYYFAIINIILHYRPEGGRFTNLSTPFSHVYLSGTYPSLRPAARRAPRTPDPELYRYRSASSEEYLESCNYRVWSTELPDRFLVWWMRPVGRDEAERRSLERELRSDEESPLHIPLEIFMTAYYERYEHAEGMASFLSRRPCGRAGRCRGRGGGAVGRAMLTTRAQAFAFIEGFVCFQQSFLSPSA